MWLQALVPAVVLVAACVRPAPAFVCAESAQCSGGICQATGFCSFTDSSCATGQRYGAASGDLGGLCVGGGAGTDAGAGSGSGDGSGGDPPRCDLAQPFGTPVLIAELASPVEDGSLRLSRDEKTGYFFSKRSGTMQLLYTASRAAVSAPFTGITTLDFVNTSPNQYSPSITADGLDLVFASYRGTNDIYQASRASSSGPFTSMQPVSAVDTSGSEVQPYVTHDGRTLYFVREDGANGTVLRAGSSARLAFTSPSVVTELDDSSNNRDPVPSPDGLTIYWGSDRPGGAGKLDIWEIHRANLTAGFSAPALVDSVNGSADDSPSDVSMDNCRLYLTSSRSGRSAIYVASRPALASTEAR